MKEAQFTPPVLDTLLAFLATRQIFTGAGRSGRRTHSPSINCRNRTSTSISAEPAGRSHRQRHLPVGEFNRDRQRA